MLYRVLMPCTGFSHHLAALFPYVLSLGVLGSLSESYVCFAVPLCKSEHRGNLRTGDDSVALLTVSGSSKGLQRRRLRWLHEPGLTGLLDVLLCGHGKGGRLSEPFSQTLV